MIAPNLTLALGMAITICSSMPAAAGAFSTTRSPPFSPTILPFKAFQHHHHSGSITGRGRDLRLSSKDFDMAELSRRIEGIQTAERLLGSEKNKNDNSSSSSSTSSNNNYVHLPVIAFDAMLPNQRMAGRTTDRTFCRLLASLGLGGLVVMVSVNYAKRKIRRNGVICRIELVDAPGTGLAENGRCMTAVDFQLVGLRTCRVVGSSTHMERRIGRWRRGYDPDGEGSKLGFGMERFVDVEDDNLASPLLDNDLEQKMADTHKKLPVRKWSSIPVDIAIQDSDANDPKVAEKAKSLQPLLEQWQQLASDIKTYDNTDVVAAARVMHGQPGLRVDPAALLRKVNKDLGEQPSPTEDPSNFALWGAALINPLPALGISPEIRGRVLEAPNAMSKLMILEWGVKRSIANLEGKTPL